MKRIICFTLLLALAVCAGFCLRKYVFTLTNVEGTSMGETLKSGDIALVTQYDYANNAPERFDIVRLNMPCRDGAYIKRVVGLPNERVEVISGRVYINGGALDEPYAAGEGGDCAVTLGDGEYFVLGDDRDVSYDSREEDIGAVRADAFLGRVRAVVWPLDSVKFGIE